MALWLYSSGDSESNEPMDQELVQDLGSVRPRFTFIPAADDVEEYYDEFIDRFGQFGYANFHLFDPEKSQTVKDRQNLLNSDMIYLSGGNTFHLLNNLRQMDLLSDLKAFVRSGKALAGHSAGAIVMSPNIRMASIPDFDRDENDINLSDWRSLGLVPFEIFPHFDNTQEYTQVLLELSKLSNKLIYAISDGAGICKGPGFTKFFGRIWMFARGHKVVINR